MKPTYLFFYKNDRAVDDILCHLPFSLLNNHPCSNRKMANGYIIEYEHIILKCFKTEICSSCFRGEKAWAVLVEDELYDTLTEEIKDCILRPMIIMSGVLIQDIIRVEKYECYR